MSFKLTRRMAVSRGFWGALGSTAQSKTCMGLMDLGFGWVLWGRPGAFHGEGTMRACTPPPDFSCPESR